MSPLPNHVETAKSAHAANGRAVPNVPAARHVNHTPFPSQYFQTIDQHGELFHVVALKVTYDMQQTENGILGYAAEQIPLAAQDAWSGEINASTPLWESDFAPYKPRCDVLVAGGISRAPASEWRKVVGQQLNPDADAPKAARWLCGLALEWRSADGLAGSWQKSLIATGPREFGFIGLGEPRPTSAVAIDWSNAFGGEIMKPPRDVLRPDGSVSKRAGADHWIRDQRNPVGKGIARHTGAPGPQLEAGGRLPYTGAVGQRLYPPIGLNAVGRDWEPRDALAGTYDDKWRDTQWPYPPFDFDYAYWNCAPLDQQISYPPPGTNIRLLNLYQGHEVWTASLPSHQLFALWRLRPGPMVVKPFYLDTLVIQPEVQRICATYRIVMSAQAQVRAVESRMHPQGRPDESVPAQELGPLG